MAFAHLVLSGTMNDRRAAEAVGLNPDTAAYTKAKPRVRAYMIEHRAAVRERLVDQEAEGLRKLNLGRDQILARLWELANLSHEATRGIIAGQIKALSMIVAIEGLIPDRRLSPPENQPAAPPVKAQMYCPQWRKSTPYRVAQCAFRGVAREPKGHRRSITWLRRQHNCVYHLIHLLTSDSSAHSLSALLDLLCYFTTCQVLSRA